MSTEREQQTVENESNESAKELLELKKDLADKVAEKLIEKDSNILSLLFKWSVSDYLIDENTINDAFHDEVLLWGIWESIWIINPIFKKYREKFSSIKTKADLEELKSTIFDEISKEDLSKPETKTWNNPTETTSSTQSSTQSSGSQSTSEKAKVDTSSESYEIDHLNFVISQESKNIYNNLKWKEKPDLEPFACALKVYNTLKSQWKLKNDKYITVIDFTKNQKKSKRCFVINIQTNTVEHAEKCWHWSGSGNAEWATSFWNVSGSHKSSLWAYITADHSRSNTKGTWHSNFWEWIEESNNKSKKRWIALLHPVKSLTYASWKPTSDWCITIPGSQKKVDKILNKIEWWSLVFAYAKSENYFAQSQFFQKNPDGSYTA